MSFAITHKGKLVVIPISEGAPGIIIWATGMAGLYSAPRPQYRCSFAMAVPDETPMEAAFAILSCGPVALDLTKNCRLYDGAQTIPDPLIASDVGENCPAFRGTKYAVFQDFEADRFENQIPEIYFGKLEAGPRP